MNNKYYKPYWFLAGIRVILVFFPQLGYIHPDEYFQSIEVFVGDFFDVEANVPWDFNVTFPIRSIGVTYSTVGTSYKILKIFDLLLKNAFNISIITPYTLLIAPRLFICLLSFLSDYSIYKICSANNEKYKSKLLILASSYVMIVFGTRTFSNTTELILFSVLLYYVSESITFSNLLIKQHEYLSKRYVKTKSPVERIKFHKLRLYLSPYNLRNVFTISTIVVLGFFNRPTFLCYALFPIFLWLYRGLGFKSVNNLQFHLRMVVLLLAAVPTILFFVLIDSFYFGYISWGEIGVFDISINSFVSPSFNFIKYNLDGKNLEQHGLHPKFLHILVNLPLLFNVLGIFVLFGVEDIIQKLTKRKYHLLPTVRSIKGLMTLSLFAPLILLSLFSHQEPRFIIPLIFPLVYLHADKLHEEPLHKLLEARPLKSEIPERKIAASTKNFMLKFWLFLNCVFVLFYGFIHQGGVYPATNYLANEVKSNSNIQYHIFTGYIYNIPRSFFLQENNECLKKRTRCQPHKSVTLYEEGSEDLHLVLTKMGALQKLCQTKNVRNKLLLVLPSSLSEDLKATAEYSNLILKELITFYPHLSTEAFPDVKDFLYQFAVTEVQSLRFDVFAKILGQVLKGFGLTIYELIDNVS